MASLVKFTPLSGCWQDSSPRCYLLEIDSFKVLLDCGLPEPDADGVLDAEETYLRTLKKTARSVDAVLLSHGGWRYLGALPMILKDLGPDVPILATVPVHHLGLMTLYDMLQSLEPFWKQTGTGRNSETGSAAVAEDSLAPQAPFTLDDVDAVFERVTQLRYLQSFALGGGHLTVTPLPGGHTLGGAMWRIRKAPAEDILYAVGFNHRREAHLEGAQFGGISRPSVLISDASGALLPGGQTAVRSERDAAFARALTATLAAGGSVLVPVDSAQRMLEIALVLEGMWREVSARASTARAFLLTHQSYRTMEFAKGLLEWMAPTVLKVFEADRSNPFDLRHISLVHQPEDVLSSAASGPVVVLASSEDLDTGPGHALLPFFAKSSSNAILSLHDPRPGSLLALLLEGRVRDISVRNWARVPLEGAELATHYATQREEAERRAAESAFAALERSRRDDDIATAIEAEAPEEEEDEEALTGLLERQIEDAAAFRSVFWVDYRSDWFIEHHAAEPYRRLLEEPDRLSELYAQIGSAKLRFQAFPVREVIRAVDEYGEAVGAAEFQTATDPATVQPESKRRPEPLRKEKREPVDEVPCKWVSRTARIAVKCSRSRLGGFEGISDGRSLRTLITRINPRRLVLVGGGEDATSFLYEHFKLASSAEPTGAPSSSAMEALAPRLMETVNLSSSLNLQSAVLSEALMASLRVSYAQDYEVSHLTARVRLALGNEANAEAMDIDHPKDTNAAVSNKTEPGRGLVLLPCDKSRQPPAPSVLIGEVRLSEVRRLLSLKHPSMKAEFTKTGDLVCNDRVIVRRADPSQGLAAPFVIEGPLCPEFYLIRNAVYDCVTIV